MKQIFQAHLKQIEINRVTENNLRIMKILG